jgi:hypothetical protein
VVVQIVLVVVVNPTSREEVDVAERVRVVPTIWVPGLLKIMVCGACGVMLSEASDATEAPAALVAVTVNEYTVPLVNPVTVKGLVPPVTECSPTLDVAV